MHSTNKIATLFAALLILSGATAYADLSNEPALVVDGMIVALIDENEIPASETGMIAEINVREGDSVAEGQSLGKIDDRRATIESEASQTQLKISLQRSVNDRSGELAKKDLAEAKQTAKEHQLLLEIAQRKAGNVTRVLASKKSQAVAKNEFDRATQSRNTFVDSVSRSEIDGLRLAYERIRLESDQAEFERQNDRLQAQAEQFAAAGQRLRIERSSIEVEQAIGEKHVRSLEVQIYRQQHALAALAAERHVFRAPFDGVVAEVLHRKGDWVKAGESVLRIIGLNRLSAEGFVSAEKIKRLRNSPNVNLEIQVSVGATIERVGKIVFISSEIDPVNNEVSFRVEFDNPDRDVLPGMRLRLRAGL